MSEPQAAAEERTLLGTPQGEAERRASWRYGCGLAALTRLHLTRTGERFFAWVHDVSLTGIAFDLLSAVEHGQPVEFQLRRSETDRLDLRAQVVHTTFADGLCRVGCVFDEPLPQSLFAAILRQLRGDQAPRS